MTLGVCKKGMQQEGGLMTDISVRCLYNNDFENQNGLHSNDRCISSHTDMNNSE